jgi:predicted HNH restriction endonuclease
MDRCQACDFALATAYGELGNGYIETPHLDPFSECPQLEWTDELQTSVDDVTYCAPTVTG